jgi:K+-sensing histidine kinase KdpD
MVAIRIAKGPQSGQSFEFRARVVSVGRSAANSLPIDDEFVSSEHGRISVENGHCIYRDLNSTNGTLVRRGEREWQLGKDSPEIELADGDKIILGGTELEVSISAPETVVASTDLGTLTDTDAAVLTDRDRLLAIYEMERTIHRELDPSRLGERVLGAVLEAFPAAESAAIGSIDAETHEITGVVSSAARGRTTMPISKSMAHKAVEERRAICFQDAQAALDGAKSVVMSGVRCAMCAPLWTGTEMRGVLQVASTKGPDSFSEGDLDLFTVFANRAAIALANAELNEERQRTAHFQELTDYLANELRCAATGLVEWLQPLEEGQFGDLDDLQLEAVRTGRIGAQMVSTLVTNMTDLSQLRDPGIVLEPTPVELHKAAQIPLKLAGAKAEIEGIEIRSDVAPDSPRVTADPQLLRRIILNLLFFGVSWGDTAGPVVLASDADESHGILSLCWQGEPVPEEHRESIFDPETQARLWKDLGRRSVGIGLAFCKVAVEAMEGRIWVETSESQNSLHVALPLAKA